MSDYSPPALIDTAVLSNFAAIGRLDLLRSLWGTLYIAQAVYEEVQDGLKGGYAFLAEVEARVTPVHPNGWLTLINLEDEATVAVYKAMPTYLHGGEAVSLALAQQRSWTFLTDDKDARRFAARSGVQVMGTLGILLQLIRQGILPLAEANELLEQMRVQARYYTPVKNLDSLINTVGEGESR